MAVKVATHGKPSLEQKPIAATMLLTILDKERLCIDFQSKARVVKILGTFSPENSIVKIFCTYETVLNHTT